MIDAPSKQAKPHDRPDTRSKSIQHTRTRAPTSRPRSCATSSPTTRSADAPCSTRATRRSTRSSSGRARTSRTAPTSPCRSVPIYIQEKIHPQALIEDLRDTAAAGRARASSSTCSPTSTALERLRRAGRLLPARRSTGRTGMILGDSLLVMTSLAEKEGSRGKVQMIYLDPPYGIKFGSNWQVSTRKRDVKDGKAEDATRQPEQIQAFRDTWKLGIHSYLAYLRDRLTVARELLTESGSIFVQIGDENVHLVRSVLDEVFGSENFVRSDHLQTTTSCNYGGHSWHGQRLSCFGMRKTRAT